ncbi:MAG: histidine kinase [Coriobacteriales bacterium]|nr:histidine kinase [Coriobacteriales bacterium]
MLLLWSARLYQSERRRTAIILLFMAAIAILTGVLEATNLVTGFIDEAFALGALLYYIHLITVHESQMQTELAEKDLELTRNKVQLLREQIRPHFVFNSLQVIKSLIRTDQDRAVLCLEDFSDYLQANLDAMASDKLVPFDTELQHVEAYVSLALADQTKPIRVEYDIQERYFSVPPLTIEPLVENAIRHGVSEGGTVTLSTYATEDGVAVVVSDDGKGIDGSRATGEHMGVGLTNVHTRLATLCDATLEFESGDTGTTVTVRIQQDGSGKGGRT